MAGRKTNGMITSIHQSMLNTWLRCGRQFEYRYIEGLIIPPGIAARRGTGFHKAAELNFREKIQTKEDLPRDVLLDCARDTYVKTIEDEGVFIPKEKLSEKKKLLNEGLNQTLEATLIYRNEIAPDIQPVMTEKYLTADVDLDLPVAGTIDCADDKNRLIDLKCMKRKDQTWADREIQPTVYSLLMENATGVWPESFRYEIVVPNKTMVRDSLETKRGKGDVERLRRYAQAFLADLKSGNFKPADPESWVCDPKWCGFYAICEYGGKGK